MNAGQLADDNVSAASDLHGRMLINPFADGHAFCRLEIGKRVLVDLAPDGDAVVPASFKTVGKFTCGSLGNVSCASATGTSVPSARDGNRLSGGAAPCSSCPAIGSATARSCARYWSRCSSG
jgi:hypothetical protein